MSLLILKEKHSDRYFSYSNSRELGLLARYIVAERFEEGWYEDADAKTKSYIDKVMKEASLAHAINVLDRRRSYEYENYEIEEPVDVKDLV